MVQGTLAYCLPRQISFSAPISSARRHWSAIVFCFVLWRKNRRSAFFAPCRVAVANLAACSPLSRPDATNRPDRRTPAAPMREWLPGIDLELIHHGLAPRGHNHVL